MEIVMTDFLRIFVAFGAGILSFFSPCILPLVPVYICFITGLSLDELTAPGTSRVRNIKLILTETILFILGFSTVFVVLGATASLLGSALFAKQRIIRIIGGSIVILLGLNLTGLFKIRFLQFEKKVHLKTKPVTIIGSFLVGMAFAFGWSPCVDPILGGILVLAATKGTLTQGILLLSVYSLGLALPFLIMGIAIGWALNMFSKMKRYLRLFSVMSGILLIVIGIVLIVWGFGIF